MRNLLSRKEAALRLNVTPRYLSELVTRGEIKYIKIGKTKKFDPDDVETYIEEGRKEWQIIHGKRKERLYGNSNANTKVVPIGNR